jgi:hypothetical protein
VVSVFKVEEPSGAVAPPRTKLALAA